MREIVAEVLLRLSKVLIATVVGLVVYGVVIGPFGATASAELALVSWLTGAAFVLLVESSPI